MRFINNKKQKDLPSRFTAPGNPLVSDLKYKKALNGFKIISYSPLPPLPYQTPFTNSTWFSSFWDSYTSQTQGISQFYVKGDKMIWGLNTKTFPYKINQTGTDAQWYWLEYYDIDNNYLGWSGDGKPFEEQYIFVPINAADKTYYKEIKEVDKPPEGTFTVWLFNNFGPAAINVYNTPFIYEEGLNLLGGVNLPWIGYPLDSPYTPPITTRTSWRADEMPKRPVSIPIFDDYFKPRSKDNTMYFNAWPIHANVNVEATMSFTRGSSAGKEVMYADAHWTGTTTFSANDEVNPFTGDVPPEVNPNYSGSVFPPPVEGEPVTFYNGIQKVNFYYTDENNVIINNIFGLPPSSTHVQYVWDKVGIVTKTACDRFPINALNDYEIPSNAAFIWITWYSNRHFGPEPDPLERQVCHPLSDIT